MISIHINVFLKQNMVQVEIACTTMYSDCARQELCIIMRGQVIKWRVYGRSLCLNSHSENFDIVSVADSNPVRLRRRPLHLVDLPLGSVSQDGYFDGLWHLLDVPDQSLVVVSCSGGKKSISWSQRLRTRVV